MRRRICTAAAFCFAERGFHRTTIPDIARRAKASVGALQHHFPSKTSLIVATAEYLLDRSVAWFRRAKADLVSGGDARALADLIARSWREQFTTAEYSALLEILIAARTDHAIRKAISPALNSWRAEIDSELRALGGNSNEGARLETALTISRCLMTGLLVHDGLLGDAARMEQVIAEWAKIASTRPSARSQGVSSSPRPGKREPRLK
jgi:AcrR family transcriptional regulator